MTATAVAPVDSSYERFLETKRHVVQSSGFDVPVEALNPALFPFQRDLVRWALRKGRAALWASTGMGKTAMQTVWAHEVYLHINRDVLILAPLAVAQQTVREAVKFDVPTPVRYCRAQSEVQSGVTITNYEMLHHFDPARFGAVVADESGILKSFDGKTRTALIQAFAGTPYRLACTATPAPNDISELANHAEFLGVLSRTEMLATFFLHDDKGWRLKGHAREPFYRWLASWGMSLNKPSDLGFNDDGYDLPPLAINPVIVQTAYAPPGQLFFTGLKGIQDRAHVRKSTLTARVQAAVDLIRAEPDEQWLVWVGLNDEGRAVAAEIPGAVLVEGSDNPDRKAVALARFADGETRVLVTKVSIAGFGLNLQRCARMVFVGLGDSYEQYFQAIRRCWRFGQTRPVAVSIVLSDAEEAVYANVLRKEREAAKLSAELVKHVAEFEREDIARVEQRFMYDTAETHGKGWRVLLGDASERMADLETDSIDLSVYSPPFIALYTYTPSERDLGNCRTEAEFFQHFGYVIEQILRVTKPGRNTCVHVADVPAMHSRDGYIGLKDFPGMTIRAFEERGWIYHGRVAIDKSPQVQALRVKAKGLRFGQTETDSSWSRPALGDYILIFRKPGENVVPISPDMSRQEWILWARPVWYAADYLPGTWQPNGDGTRKAGIPAGELGIRETDTLNAAEARSDDDSRHICPLQLGTIERCIRLWSNRGETVLSPFMGIGSEGHEALRLGRQFVGIELNPNYYRTAIVNLQRAEHALQTPDLFSLLADGAA